MSVRLLKVARRLAAVGSVFAIVTAQPATGQKMSLTPDIGVYVPTAQLLSAATGGEFKQEISLSVGGKLDLWFGNRIGIQGTGTYVPSGLTFSASGITSNESANIFMGSGRLMLFLIPDTSPVSFLINGGVGLVKRSGDAFRDLDNTTEIGGTVGAAIGFRLGRIIRLRVSGESYIYNPEFYEPTAGETSTQNDINLSFGVGIPLLGLGI